MNRVIIINLNGNAYQLEESGYEALRAYLDLAARRLEGNPDKAEIIADIEQAIAEKFRAVLSTGKSVVVTKEVESVIAEMGPVEDGSAEGQTEGVANQQTAGSQSKRTNASGAEQGSVKVPQRLYRLYDGAICSGVCNGLAAYFNLDVTLVRIGFAVLICLWGMGLLAYFLMVLVVPVARTPEEQSAATGGATTAQEFIRRARAGYYEGMKTFHDKQAHREWKRKFKQEMRGWKHGFQQNMQEQAQQWEKNWSKPWTQHPRAWHGMGLTLEILKWVKLLLLAFGVYAVYSLTKHGSVFGILPPAGLPVWIAIIIVIVIYKFVTWPIKALRYACYYRGMTNGGCGGPGMVSPAMGLIWLGVSVVLLWLADCYVPGFHEVLKQIPPLLHQAIDSVQHWLERAE